MSRSEPSREEADTGAEPETPGLAALCLGPVRATVDGHAISLSPSQTMAIALLVAAGPTGLTADELLTELHREPPGSGKQTAVMLISRLRRKVPKSAITVGGRYALNEAQCSVDAWRFSELADRDPVAAVRMWGEPFEGLPDLPPRLRTEGERLRHLYKRALDAAGWQIEPGRHEDVLASMQVALAATPHDEALTASAAAAAYRLGRQTEALQLMQQCRTGLIETHGLDPTQLLRDVEDAILHHHDDVLAARTASIDVDGDQPLRGLPGVFGGAVPDLVGREEHRRVLTEAIAQLTERADDADPDRLFVVRAEAGTGKTAMVARAIADSRTDLLQLRVGFANEDGMPYGPIIDAFPELAADFRNLAERGDPTVERNIAARRTIQRLRSLATNQPVLLVLEDLHVADSQTLALLRSITSTVLPEGVLILMTARPVSEDSEWNGVVEAMVSAHGRLIDLEPLTLANVETIVQRDNPDEGQMQQAQFARRVHELSNGNALIASILSRDAPPKLNTILLPDVISPEASLGAHLRRLIDDPGLEDLLTTAALIGRQFSVRLLAFVIDRTIDETLQQLQQARTFAVCEPVNEQTWQFDHLLTVNYFSNRMPLLRPLVFSRIARHDAAPIDSMPRYVAGAGDNLPPEFAYRALIASGRNRRSAFAFPEAVAAFTHALELVDRADGDELELRLDLAECTSRSGALDAAAEHRAAAFELACANDDHDAMSRAALAGLPSGEFAGGEPDRLALLKQVDPARVSYFSPEFLSRYLFRMGRISDDTSHPLALLAEADAFLDRALEGRALEGRALEGRALEGRALEGRAGAAATSEDAIAYQSERLLALALSAEARPIRAEMEELNRALEPGPLRAELRHRELVAAITEQQPGALDDLFDKAKQDIHANGSPRCRWAMDVLEAALDVSATRPSEINVEAARRSGVRWGIPDAHDSWFVQLWVTAYVHEMYAEALAGLDASRDQIADNLAWHAGEALCAAQAGQLERSSREVDYIIGQLPARSEGPWSQTVAALLAETAVVLGDPRAATAAHDALVAHSGRAIVLGVGSGYFGPVDRYLGLAASVFEPARAPDLFAAAIDQSLSSDDTWTSRARLHLDALVTGS